MTPRLSNACVDIELGPGALSVRWPGVGVATGPLAAGVIAGGAETTTADGPGVWDVREGDAVGRPGSWAHWHPERGDFRVGVHVAEGDDPTVVVEMSWTADTTTLLDRLTPLSGPLGVAVRRQLLDGYDSWAYSGLRGSETGASFWNSAYVDDAGIAVAVQALGADRWCTRIANVGTHLRVDVGSTPPFHPVPGTWGYTVGDPPPLRLPVDAGEVVTAETIAIGASRDAPTLVEDLAALAARAMQARTWSASPVRGWESWYHYGLFPSAADIVANARLLRARYGTRPGFDLVQVDDGWQVTYGAWWPNERFPDDLAELVGELRGLGCRTGLWLAPFMVQPGAPGLGTEHPDWCVLGEDGAPVPDRYGRWALDATHPAALEWLGALGAQVERWGVAMVKLDFLYLAAHEGRRCDARVSGVAALRQGLRAFVDALGDDVYVLGCGVPLLPAVGICHGARVGHDLAMPRLLQATGHPLDEGWSGFAGVRAQARNVAARWAQHGRWFDADPDVVMAWGADGRDPAGYPTEVARMLVVLALVCGGPFLLADELAGLTPDERAVLEEPGVLDLLGPGSFRPVDIFDVADDETIVQHAFSMGSGIPTTWVATRGAKTIRALFNWDDVDTEHAVPHDLAGCTELWTRETVGECITVPARAVRVLVA